ncbi:Protein KRI1 like [Schistosoma japonicum]|nr:Protein KRI1 like [Schistosoma japonicum]
MQFKINQDFAKTFNRYRQKEEYEKLKAKHGDANLKDIKLSKFTNGDGKVANGKAVSDNCTDEDYDESTSSSSSSDSDDSWEEKQQEDFLTLYHALCTNDPSLNDPNKQWFHDPISKSDDETSKSSDEITVPEINNDAQMKVVEKEMKSSVLKLRDYEREFLLVHGGLEDETISKEAEKISQMESDDFLQRLKMTNHLSKKQFIQEANVALKQAAINSDEVGSNIKKTDGNNADLSFLRKRQSEMKTPTEKTTRKCLYDLNKIVFTDQTNQEAENFLRDYIINKRWLEPDSHHSNKIPTYSEVLRESGLDDMNDDKMKNFLNDDDILEEDDEFLVRVNNFEQERLQSLGVNTNITRLHKIQHRFEEEDKEFIKSFPRRIENSIGQTLRIKSKRSERRQAKMERKRREKESKLQELTRLRNLKLSMLADKIERIKRTCGPGSLLLDANELVKSQGEEFYTSSKSPSKVDVVDVAEYLDEDWDPEKHEKLLNSMFGKEYEQIDEEMKKPEFSDDSDLEVDLAANDERNSLLRQNELKTPIDGSGDKESQKQTNILNLTKTLSTEKSNKLKRGKHKLHEALERNKPVFDPDDYPDYEKYFEEFYQLHCEDIIPGPTPDEDIYCRFKYRNVMPNDFGLSAEEILTADTKELNAWISLKRITAYLSPDEEMKDKELFSSAYQMKRKMNVLSSLNNPKATWYPKENEDTESTLPKKKRKRHRKKHMNLETQEIHTSVNNSNNNNSNPVESGENAAGNVKKSTKSKKKYVEDTSKLDTKDIFKSRLQAAGITLKEYHRTMRKEKKCKLENVDK